MDAEIDLYAAYRPAADQHLRINMVASADGAVVDAEGRSGTIGGSGDREVFRTLRALADAIVVGAGTARAEGYGPHRPPQRLARRRAGDGRPAPAPIAVVSGSLDLDPAAPLFAEAATRTIVLTAAGADDARRRALGEVATVLTVGEEKVDPARAVEALRAAGHRQLLLEGGPSLNAAFLDAGVVDELCLTMAPALLGDRGPRLSGALAGRHRLRLLAALTDDVELFVRFALADPPGAGAGQPGQNSFSSSDWTPRRAS